MLVWGSGHEIADINDNNVWILRLMTGAYVDSAIIV